ncbi:GNAT family N-acetyltransferase [Pullulanibacillus sp. KACC 23026]|uniref:GNAT family N-acetyltransferase n=1 Tax=Pullulanibacillus sp. KACC 23026 TaxID=3028315 RepID=UPI0023AECC43|nr:GNAT family N-acetyltransferase [Pullulanibacillus sp. KACC 23026]WEG12235.1 GNAT family N-acetyltransferase [Pullulanibacillus sp. KACC 23026]
MISVVSMNLEEAYKIRDIDRSETIELIYQCIEGELKETKVLHECPNWDEDHYKEIISRYEYEVSSGGAAYGAFDGDRLVGFAVLEHKFRGKDNDQLQIDLMYVTREYRRQGIGSKIFEALSREAAKRGARQLYISATETESAVKFYSNHGSSITPNVDTELFEKEPNDVHMIKIL